MMKVLLADDDFLVRSYLKGLIDWEAHGYQLVGTARDGEEALAMTEEQKPDLIIADISMPMVDGIELIKELKRRKNKAIVVVLSCHDEFEYVKEAMKQGAKEYILKNMLTEESLLDVLDEMKQAIVRNQGAVAGSTAGPGMNTGRSAGSDADTNLTAVQDEERAAEDSNEGEFSTVVDEMLRIIHRRFREEVSLAQIAQEVKLNPAYLSHLFHMETGRTFSEELLSCRIEEAKRLLVSIDAKMKEIGPQCGFPDYGNFCKYFKKSTGKSPQNFRKDELQRCKMRAY